MRRVVLSFVVLASCSPDLATDDDAFIACGPAGGIARDNAFVGWECVTYESAMDALSRAQRDTSG